MNALFSESRGLFDAGLGSFAYSYRIEPGGRIRLESVAGCETAPEFWRALFTWGADNQRTLAHLYQTGAGSLGDWTRAARQARVVLSDLRSAFEPRGVGDVLTIVGHDAAGHGVFITSPRQRAEPALTPRARRALTHLASELGVAARLREHRRRAHVERLSASEQRVAQRLLEGATDKAIAIELGVALSTVSTFTRRVRQKLGCRPGEEALVLARHPAPEHMQRRLALFERLTPSECDVAAELLVGRAASEIAERRAVSVRTVASQCAAIFRKCGVSGRRELAAALLSGK